jgi:DNA-binding winged helix-turn-helix (wHTH) protein/predicted ATPase
MEHLSHILFAPFRLDLRNQCLWRDERVITLTPKAYSVLLCLLKNHRQLVTKEELFNAVWPETYVTDAALKVCIGELRKALGDDARRPSFIETSHRRGYRFIGTITEERSEKHGASSTLTSGRLSAPLRLRLSPPAGLVGREANLAQLHAWLERAMEGERQVVFITGEAGIGKTTLVESFLLSVSRDPQVWIAHGQCLEQYGVGEAYLPALEAVSRLCQEPGRERLIELLRRRAPTWLLQMPWLVNADDYEAFERKAAGGTRERMLREMAETVEALTAETPLVFALEDLHWSDYSTLDLISYLARRREPARLLIIGVYRPADAISSGHPLKAVQQELKMGRRCEELALEFLSEASVGALYDPRQRHFHISDHRFDPEVALRCSGGWAQWFLGYPDQALSKIREALALAGDSRHPENLCLTTFYATFLHQLRREAQRTLELAEALIAQAGEYGLATWSAVGTSLRGWALVDLGRSGEGIAQIRHSFIAHGEAGSEVARLHFRSLLAEALMKNDQIEEALALVEGTLGAALRIGGYHFLAELYRLKGELLLDCGLRIADCGSKEAEEFFHQSIQIARRQSAKSLELRAVLSLSRLWQRQNKKENARQTLLEIYNWFTEGFDTEDLKEARALLEALR